MIPELDDDLLGLRRHLQKPLYHVHRAEFHHSLDARAIVPAAIEDDDLACGGQVLNVALHIHLRLLAFGRGGQRYHAKNARADAFRNRLDDPALARAVSTFEDDANFQAVMQDP